VKRTEQEKMENSGINKTQNISRSEPTKTTRLRDLEYVLLSTRNGKNT
jgi:hypothetical protein